MSFYLDFNATAPVLGPVRDAMWPYLSEQFGNAGSDYARGHRAKEAISKARQQVAQLIGCHDDEIVFTGGGTAANNLAILGSCSSKQGTVASAPFEHPAILQPIAHRVSLGWQHHLLHTEHGVVTKEQPKLPKNTTLVSMMWANNETGLIQPVDAIGQWAHRHGALMHSDAAQAISKVAVTTENVDLLTIVGHKFGAAQGSGALYVSRGVTLQPLMFGGGQEGGLWPTTQPVALIVGLGVAAELATSAITTAHEVAAVRDALFHALASELPEVKKNVLTKTVLPNTLSIRLPVSASEVLKRCPSVQCSMGSACHSGGISASLKNLGLTAEQAGRTLRISIGPALSRADALQAASLIAQAAKEAMAHQNL